MIKRDILSIADLTPEEVLKIVDRSVFFGSERANGQKTLQDKIVGIYFRKTSTRTRSSFTAGALKLGAQTIAYGPHDLQTNTGETVEDTAQVLSSYLDALVIRTSGSLKEMQALSSQQEMSVINAMSENEHPTQSLADLSAMQEHFGRLNDLHVLYLGEGNNTATALALAISRIPGMKLTLLTPEGYGVPSDTLNQSIGFAREYGASIEEYHSLDGLPRAVDVVYTTRWQTTGTWKDDPVWRETYRPFSVTQELMESVSKPSGTVFMHDLPAVRGEDVASAVLDGPQSIAFRQARHKLFSAMAALEWCLLDPAEFDDLVSVDDQVPVAALS